MSIVNLKRDINNLAEQIKETQAGISQKKEELRKDEKTIYSKIKRTKLKWTDALATFEVTLQNVIKLMTELEKKIIK